MINRLRQALYNEIITVYEALKETTEGLKRDIDDNTLSSSEHYVSFKRDYGYLKIVLSADTYKYAKATPALFRAVKDLESIDTMYSTFRLFENELEAGDIKTTSPKDSFDQAVQLKTVCDAYLEQLEILFEISTLDKKMH